MLVSIAASSLEKEVGLSAEGRRKDEGTERGDMGTLASWLTHHFPVEVGERY